MNNKEKKLVQGELVKLNIDFFFKLLDERFSPEQDSFYIREIQRLSQGFNIRLSREQKLKFCRKCLSYFDVTNREIRFNPIFKTKEYICKNCSEVRRIRYK